MPGISVGSSCLVQSSEKSQVTGIERARASMWAWSTSMALTPCSSRHTVSRDMSARSPRPCCRRFRHRRRLRRRPPTCRRWLISHGSRGGTLETLAATRSNVSSQTAAVNDQGVMDVSDQLLSQPPQEASPTPGPAPDGHSAHCQNAALPQSPGTAGRTEPPRLGTVPPALSTGGICAPAPSRRRHARERRGGPKARLRDGHARGRMARGGRTHIRPPCSRWHMPAVPPPANQAGGGLSLR